MERQEWRIFLVKFLSLLAVLIVAFGASQYRVYINELKLQNYAVQHEFSLLNSELQNLINNISQDSELLTNSPLFQSESTALNTELTRQALITLLAFRPNYLFVGVLDESGYEQLSVERRDNEITARMSVESEPHPISKFQNAEPADLSKPMFLNRAFEEGDKTILNPILIMLESIGGADTHERDYILIVAEMNSFNARVKKLISPQFRPFLLNQIAADQQWRLILDGGGAQNLAYNIAEETLNIESEANVITQEESSSASGCLYYQPLQLKSLSGQDLNFIVGLNHYSIACNALAKDALWSSLTQIGLATLIIGPMLWTVTLSKARSKELHREVKRINTQLKLITSEADLALLMIDENLKVKWMNPASEKILGWQISDLVGNNFHDKLHVSDTGKHTHRGICPLRKALESGEPYKSDKEKLFMASGNLVYVSMRVRPFGDTEDRGAIVALAEVDELIREQKRLRNLATTDELTQVLNRRSIIQAITELTNSQTAISFTVVMADIDYFKHVNDNFGHRAGDKVLIKFASTIKGMLRESDLIGRLGGEEFIMILKGSSLKDSISLINKIREYIERINFEIGDGKSTHITSSFGVANYEGEESVEQLLHRADTLLYKAKTSGRNRVEPQFTNDGNSV